MRCVLHVAEAIGGGTASAVHEFAASTPEYRHILYGQLRPDSLIAQDTSQVFEKVVTEPSFIRVAAHLRRRVREFAPDIVHLHSSWAGLLGAAMLPRGGVLYSPHCYYFERKDIGGVARAAARLFENAVGRRRDLVVAVSPHEAKLAEACGSTAVVVPNTSRRPRVVRANGWQNEKPRVVTVGRICAQKDARFFSEVVRVCRNRNLVVEWVWVGDGDSAAKSELESVGVRVTGWISANAVSRELASADAYLHTALWESSPMSLIEAAMQGLPIVARSIPALVSLGFPDGLVSAELVANAVEEAVALQRTSPDPFIVEFLKAQSPEAQAKKLSEVYRSIVERRSANQLCG